MGLSTCTIIFSNRKCLILRLELVRAEVKRFRVVTELLDFSRPNLDWVYIAKGMGIRGFRAETAEEFAAQFETGLKEPGLWLIKAVI